MPIANNHKLALLYMMRELLQKTDDDHTLNASHREIPIRMISSREKEWVIA